jgi:UDP-glucose 4-epimerase
MAEFDCKRIVYSSSATVYGIPPIIPIPETTKLQADSPYGKTKIMCETMLDDLCHCMFQVMQPYYIYWLEQRTRNGRRSP